jgi:hypothetical protein
MIVHQERIASGLIRGAGIVAVLLGLLPSESTARLAPPAPLYIQVPNLVGYWCVDGLVPDTATTAQDSSGNGNTGTYMSGATTMAAAPSVPTGNLQSFLLNQASRQYISVPSSPSLAITGSMTVAAWIRPTIDSTLQEGIVEKWDDPSATNGYMFRLDANENLCFSVCDATGAHGVSTAPRPVTLNVWTHVAGVYSHAAGTITNYVNGAADPTVGTGIPAPTSGSTALQIGDDHGSNAFNGNIDEVRVYNRELSVDEVGILKDGQPPATTLVATFGPGEILLSWTAPTNATTVPVQYSILRGTSSGVYDTVFNNITAQTYTDTAVTAGTRYYYAVVAVSVMAGDLSNEQSAIPDPGSPPPPPGTHTGKAEMNPKCGGAASPVALSPGLLGVLLATAVLLLLSRKTPPQP